MVISRDAKGEMTGKPDSGARHRFLDLRVDRPAGYYSRQRDGALLQQGPFSRLLKRPIARRCRPGPLSPLLCRFPTRAQDIGRLFLHRSHRRLHEFRLQPDAFDPRVRPRELAGVFAKYSDLASVASNIFLANSNHPVIARLSWPILYCARSRSSESCTPDSLDMLFPLA